MPSYGECQSAEIAATPQACFDALTDFESLPRWQRAVRAVHVLERDDAGRGTIVEYEVDVRFKTVRYRLRQLYDEPRRLASEYLGGDFRDFCGEWRLEAAGNGATHAELDLRIDPGLYVPAFLRRAISDAVMRRALRDLKAFVEPRSAS
ncbi:MAG: type II toxin-antitoxin system RatA family toxin [Thermoleophilia bacterium]